MSALPPSASIATPIEGGKLLAPSALRNVTPIVEMLQEIAPKQGRALEIASGTGQHVLAMAAALPAITWQPTEISAERRISIDAYAADQANILPAQHLDAAQAGWAATHEAYDLIYLGNLLHLIPQAAALTVLSEAAAALAAHGTLVVYGPFMRAGQFTSEGDAKFHSELSAANPEIGYKDDTRIKQVLAASGLRLNEVRDMPANNLSFIAKRELP
ncbi:hypothetical protein GGR95_003133 [Sulfitobacter undariae]|uniref:Methyltransferase n=1 Tax=Sulfitobacter undariae TaxID=1563671 RepID=A0A7W6H1R8_9RHOB|nr:DUF938 domain-containing protein [Sulfitobacter undariae]MBB3995477.1 hypothetical protein [Sulfitobacter undariae]